MQNSAAVSQRRFMYARRSSSRREEKLRISYYLKGLYGTSLVMPGSLNLGAE
jgi:hypothetical protein